MKIIYFDVETTGLSAANCAIHQLSGIVEIDGEIKETFNLKSRPFEGAKINEKALDVCNVTQQQINEHELDYNLLHNKFVKICTKYVDKYNKLDKFFLVGYNSASFDNHFLRALFLRNSDKYFGSLFWANPIDVYVLASHKVMKERHKLSDFKLKTACKYFNIPVDESKLHDSLYDVELTRQLFIKL